MLPKAPPPIEARHSVFLLIENVRIGFAQIFCVKGGDQYANNLHGSPLQQFAKENEELVVVGQVQIFTEANDATYPYKYGGLDEPPEKLGSLNTSMYYKSFIAWDRHATERKASFEYLPEHPRQVSRSKYEKRIFPNPTRHVASKSTDIPKTNPATTFSYVRKRPLHSRQKASNDRKRLTQESTGIDHARDSRKPRTRMSLETPAQPASWRPANSSSEEDDSVDDTDYQAPTTSPTGSILANVNYATNTVTPEQKISLESSQRSEEYQTSEENEATEEDEYLPCVKRRRQYRYKNRKKAAPKSLSAVRVARAAEAARSDNPFRLHRVCCRRKCFDNIDECYAWEQYKRIMVMDELEERKTLETWLNGDDMQIYFNGKQVCYRFLNIGFRFSNDLIRSVRGTPKSQPRLGPNNRRINRMTKKDTIFLFLNEYGDTVGDKMPHIDYVYLPDLEKQNVYSSFVAYYIKTHQDTVQEPPPTYSYFLRIWKKEVPNIRSRKTHNFTICSLCEKYRISLIEHVNNPKKRDEILLSRSNHIDHMRQERLGYYRRRDRAVTYPSRFCSFIIDGADQKSYGLPHFAFNTKADKGHKLKVKCVGILEHRPSKKLSLFPMREEFDTGSNHVIEGLHRVLDLKFQEEGALPPTMYVQFDNCSRENKNKFFLSYLESLVARGVFLEVQVSFLPVGHTHEDIDQAFSVVARHLKTKDAHTMTELIQDIKHSWGKESLVAQMKNVVNYTGFDQEPAMCSKSLWYHEVSVF